MSITEQFDMIGNVKLDLKDYPGQDFYSDGDTEKLLLDLVTNHEADEYNHLIAQNQYWAVLYHLSHLRGNIADFIQLKSTDKVLEIGSGCGAITSALAKSGASITCVELSKLRSQINATRNKQYSNIEIKVGNYEDIEKSLDNDYDYIFMIGVFEYAGAYINSESPYLDFMSKSYSHLKQGGSVYLAIENKFGMKYFAGAREDHTGAFYESIEGYKNPKGVKTFSLKSLKSMAKKTGFDMEFYYPYPDYKLPVTIYSDKRLPKEGELSENILNFDNSRIRAFDEGKAFDEIIAENEFDKYSNSFLLKLNKGTKPESFATRYVIYSKHSNDRDNSLKIRTDIEEDGYKKLFVLKRPCHTLANNHIKDMADNGKKLAVAYENSPFSVNEATLKQEGSDFAVEFEYVKGKTLHEELDEYFNSLSGDQLKDAVLKKLDIYYEAVNAIKSVDSFETSAGFVKIFGNTAVPSSLKSFADISNIDLIFSNVFCDEKNTVIDYEWTFNFSVPVSFVVYRALRYFFAESQKALFAKENDVYGRYGISSSLIEIFNKLEADFQKYIAGTNISLIGMHSLMGMDTYYIDDMVRNESIIPRKWHVGVYADKGNGFSQDEFGFYKAETSGDEVTLAVPVAGAKSLRIDPCDDPCMVKIEKVELIGNTGNSVVNEALVNGTVLESGMVIYTAKDPQIIVENTLGYDQLIIKYSMISFRQDFFSAISNKLVSIPSGWSIKKKGPYDKIRL